MATKKENEELIDAIKRPDRYYHITIGGYGGETTYARISYPAYQYWADKDDSELESYMGSPEDYVSEEDPDIPEEANFLYNAEDDYYHDWYEAPNELEHGWGVDVDNSWITVEERAGDDYSSEHLADIVDTEDTVKYIKDNKIEREDSDGSMHCCIQTALLKKAMMKVNHQTTVQFHLCVLWNECRERFFDGVVHAMMVQNLIQAS